MAKRLVFISERSELRKAAVPAKAGIQFLKNWILGSSPSMTKLSGYGEIGRRTSFRYWRRKAWGFKSLYPHHPPSRQRRYGVVPRRSPTLGEGGLLPQAKARRAGASF